MPIAPGIPLDMFDNVVVLDYASPEALAYLEAHGSELAAVLVEPVQSRRPELQPREFLHELRASDRGSRARRSSSTRSSPASARTPGGAQAIFGVRADIATYGKVIGGGLPIGLVAGRREYMDALDGGAGSTATIPFPRSASPSSPAHSSAIRSRWRRHEQCSPSSRRAGPTCSATSTCARPQFASRLEAHARSVGAPVRIAHFSSWLYISFPSDVPHAGLFYAMMRDRGVHVWEGRCWFLTTAHTDADLDLVFEAFRDTIAEMQAADLLPGGGEPPVPGARRGHDADGREAWFVPDPDRAGKYLIVEEAAAGG